MINEFFNHVCPTPDPKLIEIAQARRNLSLNITDRILKSELKCKKWYFLIFLIIEGYQKVQVDLRHF